MFVVLLALMLMLPVSVDAATYYVRTDGNNNNTGLVNSAAGAWRTVHWASTHMAPGDTAIVGNGTYVENFVGFGSFFGGQDGTSGAPITIQAENAHQAIMSFTGGCDFPGFDLRGSYLTIRGIRIQANAAKPSGCTYSSANAAIRHWGWAGLRVDNVRLDANTKWHTGYKVQGTGDIVENSLVENEIEGMNGADIIIRNNTVRVGGPNATYILVKGGSANALVYGNHITVSGGSVGAVLLGGDSCNGCTTFPDLVECKNCIAFNNIAVNTTGVSQTLYSMWGCHNCAIFNNVGIGGYLVTIASPSNGVATFNPMFVNNIMKANGLSGEAVYSGSTFTGTRTINWNNFFGYSSTPTQANPINGDPLFVSSSDFHLQSGSPARNTGVTVTAAKFGGGVHSAAFDKDGVSRPQGSAWDAGIYEEQVLAASPETFWAHPSGNNAGTCTSSATDPLLANPSGTPSQLYLTIGRAANCVTVPGSTVMIKAGTYTGSSHRIKTDAETTGFASGTSDTVQTVLRSDPAGAVPVLQVPNWYQTYDNTAAQMRNYITIRDVIVDGTNETDGGGCTVRVNGHHVTLDNVEIRNPHNVIFCSFVSATAGQGSSHHITVRNSRLHGQARDGNGGCYYIAGADDFLFENNECYDIRGQNFGQAVDDAAGRQSNRPIVRYNYFHDIVPSTQPTHNGCNGISFDGIDALVHNNRIIGQAACNNGLTSGHGGSGSRLIAYNNTIVGFGGVAISYGIFATTLNNDIKNNIIVGGSTTANIVNESANGSTLTTATNACRSVTNCGSSPVVISALTTCTVSLTDFHLRALPNPCVDSGTTTSQTTATEGVTRPQGSAFDIGAYELVVSGPTPDTTPPATPTGLTIE